MKSPFLLPLSIASALAAFALLLAKTGMRAEAVDALAAALIAGVGGTVGLLPILVGRPADQGFALQLALGGTVLHLLSAAAIAISLIATGTFAGDGRFGFWLIGGYWMSLFVTVAQLRRIVLTTPNAKAES
jgi:hypothetical protein